eukprot:m.491295 g.491295  ORF g.491295 m.491295 type:complete len:347 (+) comp21784_c0_seq29:296-1336(+)
MAKPATIAAETPPVHPASSETWTRFRKFMAVFGCVFEMQDFPVRCHSNTCTGSPQVYSIVMQGYASGVSLVLAGHPFDTIKVRLQAEGVGGRFGGVVDCVRTTVVHEGITGLYKGMSTPLVLTGMVNSLLFGMQYNIEHELSKIAGREGKPLLQDTMQAAVLSGAAISIVVTPMEGIKARLQVQYGSGGAAKFQGPVDCARQVYRTIGMANGIYRGWLPVCISRMANFSYFGSYAFISKSLHKKFHGEAHEGKKLPLTASILAGGSSGFCYWLTCYPVDVVKNKIMAAPDSIVPKYKNMRDAFRQVYRAEGVRGFFVGFAPCVIRAFPANAAAFVGFELAMRYIPE